MSPAVLALYAAAAAATTTGVLLGRRERGHRPVAAMLGWGLLADVTTRLLRPTEGWAHPLEGGARAGFHVAEGAQVGYPVAVLGAVAVVLGPLPRQRVLAVLLPLWGLLVAVLVTGYGPLMLWDGRLERVYAVVQALVVAVLVAVLVRWRLRSGGRPRTATEVVVWMAAAAEGLNLAGPYALGFARWPQMAGATYGIFYVVATLLQGGALWKDRQGS